MNILWFLIEKISFVSLYVFRNEMYLVIIYLFNI